ncbi:MAG: hypothetical protein ACI8PQ_001854 [Planctomycetota bacterium]|jgi:hypothetical protein
MKFKTKSSALWVLAIAAGLALNSCTSAPATPSPGDDFALAQQLQTVDGWQAFLLRHAGTEFESVALVRLQELEDATLAWREAERDRTFEDDQAWEAAGSGETLLGCFAYLASYSKGSHAEQANQLGAALARAVIVGAKDQVLPGEEFPYGDFEADETLAAMGIKNTASATRSTVLRAAGSSEVVTRSTTIRVGWMNGAVAGLPSGRLAFLQEKTESFSGLVIDVEDSPAADDSTKGMRIHGTGYAIVDFDGEARVYKFE